MDIKLTIALFTSIMAIFLAFLNFRLTREGSKSNRNADLKTKSYIDFISAVAETTTHGKSFKDRPKELTNRLIDAKTRIAIYGDPSVVSQLAEFDREFGIIQDDESRDSFLSVVEEMRKAATGRSASDLNQDIRQVLFGS